MDQKSSIEGALPRSIDPADYGVLRAAPEQWLDIASSLAARHGLDAARTRPVSEGSNLVALIGDHSVIKVFPPFMRNQYESERRVLPHLHGRLSVPLPALIAEGEVSGWPYLLISQLEGVSLDEVWPTCTHDARREILRALGGLIAEVQAVPSDALSMMPPEWNEFIAGQARACAGRHRRLGFPLWAQIDPYLQRTARALPTSFQTALLTGEYTPDNVLMSRAAGGGWHISGLIDFGDAMLGFAEYDLLGPSTFLAGGDAELVSALLEGYGYREPSSRRGLGERLMRMALLHRFSDFRVQVRIDGWQDRARSLDELRRLLWPIDGDD